MSHDNVNLYLYEMIEESDGVGIFTEAVSQPRLAELPKRYSTFTPPTVAPGEAAYFDGMGWTTGPALEHITTEMVADALRRSYAKNYMTEIYRQNEMQKITTPVDEEIFDFMGRAAMRYVEGDVDLFRMLVAAEKKQGANIIDAKHLDVEYVDAQAREVLKKYRYTQFRKASIVGEYRRLCAAADEVAKKYKIVKALLYGHS